MNLGQSHSQLLDFLLPLALQVSAYQLRERAVQDPAKSKPDGSLVTVADVVSEAMIHDALKAEFDEIVIVGEEAYGRGEVSAELLGENFFLIDALDGTREFANGNDDFTINVALVQAGVASFGLVVAPAHGTAYWGSLLDMGAFRAEIAGDRLKNVTPIRVSGLRKSVVMLSRSRGDKPEVAQFLGTLDEHSVEYVGSSLKSCRIAEGTATHYPCFGDTFEWDTAASQAVLEAAGGYVRTLAGERPSYGKFQQDRPLLNPWFIASAS